MTKIKKILANKDYKALVENFLSLSVIQGIGYLLPFITLSYITKTIGLEYFGQLAYATAIVVFFQTFVDYGFNYTAVRDLSRVRENSKKASELLSKVMYAKLILLFLAVLILFVLLTLVPKMRDNYRVILCTFTLLPGYLLFPTWFFQGIEKMKYSAILSFMIKLMFTFSIFIFIQNKEDYIYIPLINSLGFLIVGVVALYLLYKQGFRLVKVKYSEIFRLIKMSTNMFISLIIPNLYTNMSIVYLGNFWNESVVGIFSGGHKFISFSDVIIQVFSRTFYPFLARRMDKHTFYKKIGLSLGIFLSVMLFLLAPFLVDFFYEKEFSDALTVIRIMSISPFLFSIMNIYGTNYLVLHGKENLLRNIIVICSLVGGIISYFLILKYSYIGAAATITIVWAIRAFATFYAARIISINEKI